MHTENQEVTVSRPLRVKIIGVGGAGCHAVEHVMQTELVAEVPLAVVHTHARVLQQHVAPQRLLIGLNRTHGLGSGGDAELARIMAESDRASLANLLDGADLIFIVAGLGGGTGTGVTSVLAKVAKESGALVIAVVTTPFEFEGDRRHKQAQFGLQTLRSVADAVICLPNQKLCRLLDENTTIVDAFVRSNTLMVQGIRGIWQMLTRPGLINVDFAYLCSVLRGRHTESVLAAAEAVGQNRAREVVERILANPMLEEGLTGADQILVSMMGPQNVTITEITLIMDQLRREIGTAELVFGTALDPALQERICLTLVASRNAKCQAQSQDDRSMEVTRQVTSTISAVDAGLLDDSAAPRPPSRFIAPPPESTPEKARELLERQPASRMRRSASKWKQQLLALEIVSRGRFEKSEPTIHRGADLDVPTYVRRGVPLN